MNLKAIILLLIGVWLGILIGISFIEAPLKFQAPGITMKLGVGIGRLVFTFSNKVQIVLMVAILIYFLTKNMIFDTALFPTLFGLFLIMAIQTFYLFPALDIRAQQLLQDQASGSSNHHIVFIICEVIKVILLIRLFLKTYSHE